ncbi:hypothetical protein PsorP6_010916 [Peronosclerospora sorghi]|uniref:Uncharacterized protein n=1 Tax=Peronosclerospora sorghi TaxID=230839 RepID=A0ACC0VUW3_9STRA|nr:hypothetical protein PsorP6_010916 [Peronosclerospora sorghi]
MPFAENLAVGRVCFQSQAQGAVQGELKCVSVENYRSLPALPLDVEFLSDSLQVQGTNEGLVVVDTRAELLYLFSIEVTVQSESCRLRQVDDAEDGEVQQADVGHIECPRKLHWLYTFYHVFEKFPVQGLLNDGERRPVSIAATCPVSMNPALVLENCHDFFSLLMSDLMALNKPLQGLNLTKGLGVHRAALDGIHMKSMSLTTFFQTLITFLPIQICRAEANALRLLQDGMSQQRTDQEDVLLGVLNASVSMFTIFRMEMRLDKEVDGLFAKFQKGMHLVKKESRLFQGCLYMSVKDINLNDGRGVIAEFTSKIQKVVAPNCDRNFINEMYSGKVNINCSPPLGTTGYCTSLGRAKQLVDKIMREQATSPFAYRNGEAFHDCMRLVLAKIAALDWTTLDATSQQLEMKNVHRKVPGILRTGALIPAEWQTKETVPRYLMEPVATRESDVSLLKFDLLAQDHPEWLQQWPLADQLNALDGIEDTEIDFGPSVCSEKNVSSEALDLVLMELFQQYLELTCKGAFERISETDSSHFDIMVSFLVKRRKVKVAIWVKNYLGPDRFLEEWDALEHSHLVPFESLLKRCHQKCSLCHLECMRCAWHSSQEDHDCGMSHVCRGLCEFCMTLDTEVDQLARCSCRAGHEGRCNCGKGDHTCGDDCALVDALNCQVKCELKTGHRGPHRCSVKQHICGLPCSASNCNGQCSARVEEKHRVHKCASNQCHHLCEMEGCSQRCSTANHFHGSKDPNASSDRFVARVKHMCNQRHVCKGICESPGICSTVIRVSSRRFNGSHNHFDYDLKQMVAVRKKCAMVLQPGQVSHYGVHSCGKVASHGCESQCRACKYYCDQALGHTGAHSTSHGNMTTMHFIAPRGTTKNGIAWNRRVYAPGEEGIAEMCGLYCSTGGRGHVHYVECGKQADKCVYSGRDDHRRHCNKSLLTPEPKSELDEVLHAEYWQTIGWEDPCSSARERAEFAKCPMLCNDPEHHGNRKGPSWCDLPAWHHPMVPRDVDDKYRYVDGHRLACSHVSASRIVHHIFVLDCSGSMRGDPWQTLMKAVSEYLKGRLASGYEHDIVSVVSFGDTGRIEYEEVKITSAVSQYVNLRGGGTLYAKGLREAGALLSRTNMNVYRPVLIFFTDGRPADAKQGLKVAKTLRQSYVISGLWSFVVGFGKVSDAGLKELAKALGGKVHKACSVDMIPDTFRSISKSLGACAGLICNN